MRGFLSSLLLLVSLFRIGPTVSTDPIVQILDANVTYSFGESIDFSARIEANQPIQIVYLSFQAEGEDTILNNMTVSSDGQAAYHYDTRQQALRPFSRVYYWFRVVMEDGTEFSSASYWFDYEDNRYTWQTLENGEFSIHWIDGDAYFGQTVMNVAHDGLESAKTLLPVNPPLPINIYVYPTAAELQSALQLAGRNNVAGYAQPDLGVVMISISDTPEQRLELERQIPHELTHLLLFQATGPAYSQIPGWLVEGMASLAELYTNPDYARMLTTAKNSDSLLPISSLCGGFPESSEGNFLAYAEAASFTRYLNEQFGTPTIQSLIQGYANGYGCEEGVQNSLGKSLQTLETEWRADELGINTQWLAFINLLPYLVVLGIIFIPSSIFILRSSTKQAAKKKKIINRK